MCLISAGALRINSVSERLNFCQTEPCTVTSTITTRFSARLISTAVVGLRVAASIAAVSFTVRTSLRFIWAMIRLQISFQSDSAEPTVHCSFPASCTMFSIRLGISKYTVRGHSLLPLMKRPSRSAPFKAAYAGPVYKRKAKTSARMSCAR